MNDLAPPPLREEDAPVNPYSLLQAVNSSSDTAHTAWLIFIGLMCYLMIAVAGVTHKDLLLSRDIQLPILQVSIDLTRFFLFAPFVVVLFHVGVVAQLVMLARKTLELHHAISLLETTDRRTHPLRLELHNFFFVQAIAGPERSQIMSVFLHGMSWLSLVILPVVLILFIQVAFLPYHDVTITMAHRVALLCDLAFMTLIGVFLMRPESSFIKAFWRTGFQHPFSFLATLALMVSIATFSLFVATVPGERLDRLARRLAPETERETERGYERYAFGAVTAFLSGSNGRLLGLFDRNINVADVDLVADKDVIPGEPSLNLRGRDLRYARLDRADLHQADLTGARLDGASLVGTDLRNVFLQCADVEELLLTDDRIKAKCPSARRVNLTRARMSGARLAGIDLTGARLEDADLTGAELSHSRLTGASFYSARLERATLTGGIAAEGVNFATAALQGADLNGARLIGADFTSATMQGVNLQYAQLYGAALLDADLEGAILRHARLQGADLTGASLRSADLRETAVWQATVPEPKDHALTDFAGLTSVPLPADEQKALSTALTRIGSAPLRTRLRQALAGLTDQPVRLTGGPVAGGPGWAQLAGSPDAASRPAYRGQLSDALLGLMCKARWSNGSVATGIVRRALAPEFDGDARLILLRLRDSSCAGGQGVDARLVQQLATAVETAKSP